MTRRHAVCPASGCATWPSDGRVQGMHARLPILALLLGAAGLLPFLLCGLLALGQNGERAAFALVCYGAVILAFLGGVHWGLALQEPSARGQRARLGLGVVPSLVGWIALLLALAFSAAAGLGLLLIGFAGTTIVEARAARAGLLPAGYMTLRYGLTAGVTIVLVLVLLMRLFGVHVQLW